jgi:hypothetical protein
MPEIASTNSNTIRDGTQKVPEISLIHVSREKDGKLRLVYAGWNDAKVVQLDGCGQARRRGWKVNPTSGRER